MDVSLGPKLKDMNIILVIIFVGLFIGVPLIIYDKTVEISSKYPFTKFLIAWPLRLATSLLACGFMIVISFLPITIVFTIVGVLLCDIFNFNDKYVEYIVYGVLILNATWLIRGIVLTTMKEFIKDFISKP